MDFALFDLRVECRSTAGAGLRGTCGYLKWQESDIRLDEKWKDAVVLPVDLFPMTLQFAHP